MKRTLYMLFFFVSTLCFSKEYKCIIDFQNRTRLSQLRASDWLKSDRKNNTQVWQNANEFNLSNQRPFEYETIVQRRDFYEWLYKDLDIKKNEIVWPKMAHYISKKLRLTKAFPFSIFTKKKVKEYAHQGSETVFNQAFELLNELFNSNKALNKTEALEWDKTILKKEQYVWLENIYSEVDSKTLNTITKMAKGKGFYSLLVPKEIRFKGQINNADTRYQYALKILRDYSQSHYQ